jgi:hypothetical protein
LPQKGLKLGQIGRPPECGKALSKLLFRRSGLDQSTVTLPELAFCLFRFGIHGTATTISLFAQYIVDVLVFPAFAHPHLVTSARGSRTSELYPTKATR